MKLAIVTGCSSGLGQALVQQLTREGHHVLGIARRPEKSRDGFTPLKIDLARLESVQIRRIQRVLTKLLKKNPESVLLFHCAAGVEPLGPVGEIRFMDARRSIALNVEATFMILGLFLAATRSLSVQKTAVLVSSGASGVAVRGASLYCASKAALEALARVAAAEQVGEKHPVRVVAIQPGIFESPMQKRMRETPFADQGLFKNLKNDGRLKMASEAARELIEQTLSLP